MSKTFDNGMICASEQSVIVDKEICKDFEKFMKEYRCYFLDTDEINKLEAKKTIQIIIFKKLVLQENQQDRQTLSQAN